MKNPFGYSPANLRLAPLAVTHAKARGEQFTHGTIHPESLFQPLRRSHRANNRQLPGGGIMQMIRLGDRWHWANVSYDRTMARTGAEQHVSYVADAKRFETLTWRVTSALNAGQSGTTLRGK